VIGALSLQNWETTTSLDRNEAARVLSLEASRGGLDAGIHEAIVTITGAGQTQQMTVELHVEPDE
jgi:hypothetical protein